MFFGDGCTTVHDVTLAAAQDCNKEDLKSAEVEVVDDSAFLDD